MGKYLLSKVYNLYVASAVYADRAGTADTASNSLKLGGYNASDYLRKDEVQTVTAAYQEIEWTTPGTYDWVVPEGVNSILVTTVGGGGGYGFHRFYPKDSGASSFAGSYKNNPRYLFFPGGAGGEVVVNKLIKTTPGETLQIVVGAGGANVTTADTWGAADGGSFNEDDIIKYNGKNGSNGGISYIARNGTVISTTKARGGAGGYARFTLQNSNNCFSDGTCYYYYSNANYENTSLIITKYRGGFVYWMIYKNTALKGQFWGIGSDNYKGLNGYSGVGGTHNQETVSSGYTSAHGYWRSPGIYVNTGGGGSWGDGGSSDMSYGTRAGVGGGGIHIGCWHQIYAGHGMVRILAIGVTYDE